MEKCFLRAPNNILNSHLMPTTLILGSTSDIARAIAKQLAEEGHQLMLAGRSVDSLTADASDLQVRYGAQVSTHVVDAGDVAGHEAWYQSLPHRPDWVVCAIGWMTDQAKAQQEWTLAEQMIMANYTGVVSLLHHVANEFEARGTGVIAGISSVAGDRGRASNYFYGSAKAGFSAFLSGLRNRLAGKGVHVLTVKPGFVDTKMTSGLELPPLLTAQPERVAKDIIRGMRKKKNIVYTKWMWRYVMLIIKNIPEAVFKKLSL